MNKLATQHQIECMELAAINARTERRRNQERMERLEAAAIKSEQRRRAEKARHEEEMKVILYGTSAFACLFAAVSLFVTAPWWSAVAPLVFGAFVLRKAGW